MKNQDALGSQVDLNKFFEASVRALQNTRAFAETGHQNVSRNGPLVQRTQVQASREKRAVADAAKALTALWIPVSN